jgi:hypothetical protein
MSTITRQKAESAARRLRTLRLTRWLLWSLFGAGLVNLILVLAAKFEFFVSYLPINLGIVAAALVFGSIWGLSAKKTPFEAARIVDSKLDLKERIASALEFEGTAERGPIHDLQAQDAEMHAAGIDVRRILPHRFTKEAKLVLAVAAAVLIAVFVPQTPLFQSEQEQAEKAEIKRQGAKIVQLSKRLHATEERRSHPPEDRLCQDLEELGKRMQQGRASKKEALKKLNDYGRQLDQQRAELAQPDAGKSFNQAAAELKRREAALPKLPEAAKKLPEFEKTSKLSESLKDRDFGAASRALEELAKQLGKKKLDPEQLKGLAERLGAMAGAFKETDLDKFAKLLEKALENVDPSDLDLSAEDLEKAAEVLCELGKDVDASEELQRLARLLEGYKQKVAMSGLKAGAEERAGAESGQSGTKWGEGVGNSPERQTDRVDRETMEPQRPPSQYTPGEALPLPYKGAPGEEEGKMPFYQVFGRYQKAAEAELHREEIPAAFRKQIKDYFDSITPTGDTEKGKGPDSKGE